MNKVDLAPFCDNGDGSVSERYDVREPFVRDGYEYATDGRICIRRRSKKASEKVRKVPKPAPFFETVLEFQPVPPPERGDDCMNCSHGQRECDSCGQMIQCKACNGSGAAYFWIGPFAVSGRYDRLIRSLPDLHVAFDMDNECVRFRSGELEGALKCLGEPDEPHAAIIREYATSQK